MAREFIVPEEIFEALEVVRESGEANIFDRQGIQVTASKYGYHRLVVFLEDNRDRYAEILTRFGTWKKGKSS